jgi:antitoxin (DNA-binding transcriptional repressor) of toxin-antitoxin stability system
LSPVGLVAALLRCGAGHRFSVACLLFDSVHLIAHNIALNRVNIHDGKTNLSRYLAELKPGETLVLCNRNRPVAELRSLRKKGDRKPRIGAGKAEFGEFAVPDSFFEPLPDEISKAFSGN